MAPIPASQDVTLSVHSSPTTTGDYGVASSSALSLNAGYVGALRRVYDSTFDSLNDTQFNTPTAPSSLLQPLLITAATQTRSGSSSASTTSNLPGTAQTPLSGDTTLQERTLSVTIKGIIVASVIAGLGVLLQIAKLLFKRKPFEGNDEESLHTAPATSPFRQMLLALATLFTCGMMQFIPWAQKLSKESDPSTASDDSEHPLDSLDTADGATPSHPSSALPHVSVEEDATNPSINAEDQVRRTPTPSTPATKIQASHPPLVINNINIPCEKDEDEDDDTDISESDASSIFSSAFSHAETAATSCDHDPESLTTANNTSSAKPFNTDAASFEEVLRAVEDARESYQKARSWRAGLGMPPNQE